MRIVNKTQFNEKELEQHIQLVDFQNRYYMEAIMSFESRLNDAVNRGELTEEEANEIHREQEENGGYDESD